jgi:hypothetical protein
LKTLPKAIQDRAQQLFWDVDPRTIDLSLHRDFVLGRVLSEGDWDAVRSLRDALGDEVLADFVARAPHRLDARSRRFFEVVLPPPSTPCTTPPFRRNSDALFLP